jgi:hypothetical protein
MSATPAFAGTFLLSLFVALLAALQLADYFGTTDRLAIVLAAVAAFVTISLLAFVAANSTARRPGTITCVAIFLALVAAAPLAWPAVARAGGLPNPLGETANLAMALEFIVPALIAVLMQWGLVRRRWLRLRGEEDLSRWPWFTTAVAALAILSPFGLDALGQSFGQALGHRTSGWSRETMRTVTLGAAGAMLAMAVTEYYIRDRMRRRRLSRPPMVGIGAAG